MQHTHKNGKRVTKHLLVNMLHNILIPDFGASLKVAFNNICLDSCLCCGNSAVLLHITIRCLMKVDDTVQLISIYFQDE